MIDTIKLHIPLTETQHQSILLIAEATDRDQFARVNLLSGELRLFRVAGLATTDQHSFHREIRWDIPPTHSPGCCLVCELSLPKFWYGDNVRLLYDSRKALDLLRDYLNKAFQLRTKRRLTPIENWRVTRLDCCYCWRFPTQQMAKHFLESLKNMRLPHKGEPIKYHNSILFKGGEYATYSAKFYLKLPEFLSHDAKAMRKAKAFESEIRLRESLAEGLLRFEVTLREKWLKRHEIETVADVIHPFTELTFDSAMVEQLKPFWNPKLTYTAVLGYWVKENQADDLKLSEVLKDGSYLSAPPATFTIGSIKYNHPGGGFRVKVVQDRPEQILKDMLEKIVGNDASIGFADKVRQLLLDTYKPSTAANLTAFWLYVQKFGSDSAKEVYGRRAYYYKKQQLKKAKVSLLERKDNTIIVGKEFFDVFSLSIPSEYVGNKVDDERDSINVLNIVPRLNNSSLG
jgi:hypothetical protein